MKKSAKRSIIVSAVLAIIMCVSLVAGATFALFTSESTVNIAVTSGKVNVVATVDEKSLTTYSGKDLTGIVETDKERIYATDNQTVFVGGKNGTFANGGTAEFKDGTLKLANMTPGDKVTFTILIKNESNVKVQYRTVWMSDGDDALLSGLDVKVNNEIYDGSTLYANWATLEVRSEDLEVPVEISMSSDKTNEYQEKTCKLIFNVEAMQFNAYVDNYVAKIGENKYEALTAAIAALNGGQVGNTLEITRPGTYAPFKITREGATVKGIIGKTKAESTVIKNTANQNIQAYADNITLQNLWIDSTTPQSINWMNAGAVDPYRDTDNGKTSENLKIDGCTIDGTGAAGSYAFLYCEAELTLTGNTFNNFDIVYSAMRDDNIVTKATITGNTFNNVTKVVDGYWGGTYEGSEYNIIITDNKMNGAAIHLRDYHQYKQKDTTAPDGKIAIKAQIKDNTGDYSVILTHNNWFADNGHDIEASANVYYRRLVKFDVDSADYKVYNKDGSELNTVMGDSTTLGGSTSNYYLYAITEGEYLVKNTSSGETYPLTVKAPGIGKTQVFKPISDGFAQNDEKEYFISNANGFGSWCDSINTSKTSYKDATVKLTSNIDYTGKKFTPLNLYDNTGGNGDKWKNMTIDGGGYTLSGISPTTTEGDHGFGIIAAVSSSINIKNITFDKIVIDSRVNSYGMKNSIGVVIGQAYGTVDFENVTVKNSEVYGFGKVGVLLGHAAESGMSVSFKYCTLSNNIVSGAYNMGGLIGLYQRDQTDNSENVTIENVNITGTNFITNAHSYYDAKDIITLENATITCDENASTTCIGKEKTISGKYIKYSYNGCYYGFCADYYVSFGQNSHDCKTTYNNQDISIANSEICVNAQ